MPIPASKHNDIFGDLPPEPDTYAESLPLEVWLPFDTHTVGCNRCPFKFRAPDDPAGQAHAARALAHHHRNEHTLHPETGELERLAESARYLS